MSWNMSARSTVLASVVAALLLGITTAFVAFGPEDEGEIGGSSQTGEGLPEGFSAIPADVFVERVFGTQRAQESWHMEQQKTVDGRPGTLIRLDTEDGGARARASVEISREDGSTTPLQVIAIDGIYYAKAPELFSTGDLWWKADPDAGGAQASSVAALEQLVAPQTSDNIGDAVDEVELVGPDQVEGVTTAHYRLHLTQPVAAPPGVTPTASPEGQPEATLDVWVDQQDRPIRLVTTSVVDGAEVVYTTMFSRYGAEFGIQPPPAGQVTTEVPESER